MVLKAEKLILLFLFHFQCILKNTFNFYKMCMHLAIYKV